MVGVLAAAGAGWVPCHEPLQLSSCWGCTRGDLTPLLQELAASPRWEVKAEICEGKVSPPGPALLSERTVVGQAREGWYKNLILASTGNACLEWVILL